MAARVLAPELVPARTNERAVFVPLNVSAEVLLKFTAPAPEESMVAPEVPIVIWRSVVEPVPRYWRVPPLMTRLAAALEESPRLSGVAEGVLLPTTLRAATPRM